MPSRCSGLCGQRDPEDGREHQHHHRLGEGADPGGERLAGDQGGPRRGGDEQLGQHAGVAVPDDLDAVEDRDEQRGLGDDAGREEVEVGHVPGRDGVQVGEGLAEDEQPERGLDGPGEQLGPVVAQLLQLDEAERHDPGRQHPPRRRAGRRASAATAAARRVLRIVTEVLPGLVRQARPRPSGGTRPRAWRPRPRRRAARPGVPAARTRPRCMRATRSQCWSASSM